MIRDGRRDGESGDGALRRPTMSARNVAASYAGVIAEGVVFLLLTPFLVRHLGLAQYGLWSLAVACVDWTQLFDLGLREAVMKFAAAHQARAEAAAVRRLAESALLVYAVVGACALAAMIAFCWLGLPHLVGPDVALEEVRAVVMLLGVSAALSFPAGIAGTLLEGLSRFDLLNAARAGHACLRLVLVVLALQFDLGVVGVAAAELCARLGLHATRWIFLAGVHRDLIPRPGLHAGDLVRLFGFGLWNVVRQAAEVAMSRMYEPLLAVFAGLPSVGAFHAGRRLATMPGESIVPLAGVLFPLSSEMEAGGRERTLRKTLFQTTKLATGMAFPLSVLLAFGARPIQVNWLGNRAPEAEDVLRLFALAYLFVASAMPAESMLLGLGRVRLLALAGLANVALTIGLGIPLTQRFGASGLAAAACISVVVTHFAVFLPAAAWRCGTSPWRLFAKAVLPTWLAGAPVAVLMLWLEERIAGGGLAALATWGGGAMATYAAIFWRIGLDGEERSFLKSHVRRIVLDSSEVDDWEDPEG